MGSGDKIQEVSCRAVAGCKTTSTTCSEELSESFTAVHIPCPGIVPLRTMSSEDL